MGVIPADAMQHAALAKDVQLRAGHDHHRYTQRLKQRPSFKNFGVLWPSMLCKQRRIPLRRSFSTPLAMSKHPISVSSPVSEPPAAHMLQSSFNPSSLAAPASGMEPQQLFPPCRISLSSFDKVISKDDSGLDYREAAAALEQLFTEGPTLEIDRISTPMASDRTEASSSSATSLADPAERIGSRLPGSKKKGRKDLMARIILRRKRMVDTGDHSVQEGTKSSAVSKLSDSIWSPAASNLLRQHGEVVNLVGQNWSQLRGELLSADEERWLGYFMKTHKALSKVKDTLMQQIGREPSYEEWAQASKMDLATLTRHLALHQAARNKLVKMNLRLVKHQARKYEKESMGSSLTVVELCQEGVKGLITSAVRFNPSKGVRFSTYAVFWIRNSILRAQTRSGFPIRAPFNFAEIKMSINKARWEMAGESLSKVLERVGVDEEKYKTVLRSNPRVVSLHKRDPVTGAELIERLADPNSHHDGASHYLVGGGSGIEACDPLLRLGIDDVLDSLKPKESSVLRQRFGLDGKGERALGEIGRNMRISREMVRCYEARGLLKLKHPTRIAYLRSFLSRD